MKRILMYDCNTVDTVYAPLVCREIMMQDDLIDRLACGYVSKNSKKNCRGRDFAWWEQKNEEIVPAALL